MAVTTNGTLVANVTHAMAEVGGDPQELLDAALASCRQVFLGALLKAADQTDKKGDVRLRG